MFRSNNSSCTSFFLHQPRDGRHRLNQKVFLEAVAKASALPYRTQDRPTLDGQIDSLRNTFVLNDSSNPSEIIEHKLLHTRIEKQTTAAAASSVEHPSTDYPWSRASLSLS